jgi:hypothetical protein
MEGDKLPNTETTYPGCKIFFEKFIVTQLVFMEKLQFCIF